jgi:general secretion pathway protein G
VRLRGELAVALRARRIEGGFTLVELALVFALIGILSAIAISGYANYQERARKTQAIVDIKNIATEIDGHEVATGKLPSTLVEAGVGGMIDVWGNPYQYLRLDPKDKGQPRKDKFIVPINSDFDLYSMGPDGRSAPPLTSKLSRDDIIRASNGSYIGVAANY